MVLALGVGVGHLAPFALGIHRLHLGAGKDLDALLLKGLLEGLADLFVFVRNNARQVLYDGHLSPHGVVDVGEFHPDGSGADNHHALGLLGQHHGLAVPDDFFAVLGQVGQHAATSARGDDDVLRADHLGSGLALDLDLAAGHQGTVAHVHVDFIFLHQELNALGHAVGDVAAAAHHLAEIVLGILHRNSVFLGVLNVLKHLRTLNQRLSGNAAPVKADSAQAFFFNHRRFQAQLASADRGHIAAGAGAQYQYVVFHGHKGR